MGNGSVMSPRGEHIDQRFTYAEIGKSLVCSNFLVSFSIGCAESQRRNARSISTRWRDCRWAISIAAIRAVLAHGSSESVLQPPRMGWRRRDEKRFTTCWPLSRTANVINSVAHRRAWTELARTTAPAGRSKQAPY